MRTPEIQYGFLMVPYSLSPGIPGKALKLHHSILSRGGIVRMMAVALLAIFSSESRSKGHQAIEIKTGIACLVQSRGLAPSTNLEQALAAYADTVGSRPRIETWNRWPRSAQMMSGLLAASQAQVVALAACPPPTPPYPLIKPQHRYISTYERLKVGTY